MPTARTAFGITYQAYSLQDWRKLRTPQSIPRSHWPILRRTGNYEPGNRIDRRAGAIPQLGGVDHIGAGFQDNNPIDLGAERLTEYGLNPGNRRASWHAAVDSNTICLLAPPDTRPWVHGGAHHPYDMNSYALGIEDGILSPNWDILPAAKKTAHLRMRAAWWALWFGYMKWPLKYTPNQNDVWAHIRAGRSWGLTQHGDIDPRNRSDAGIVYRNGRRVNTFPYDRLFAMMREEMKIIAGGGVSTPGLPDRTKQNEKLQRLLNELGNNLDVDGSFGPLTEDAAEDAAKDTGFTGNIKSDAFITHLEKIMSKIDEVLKELKQRPDLDQIVNAVKWELRREESMGFSADFWRRLGSVPNPKHKSFPADTGSPVDLLLRVDAHNNDGYTYAYTTEGPKSIWLNPKTDRFELKERP